MINKSDKILLTGGTGFLGSHILEELLARGYNNILVLSRSQVTVQLEHVDYVRGDILDVFFLESILQDVDCIIHAAAIVSFHKSMRKEMFEVNVEGTANLVNLALMHSVRSFVYVSSAAAIGQTLDESLISEQTKWNNKLAHTQYALSKFMGEKQVWRGHAEGLAVSIVNPALILGKGNWQTGSSGFFSKIYHGLKYYPTGSNGLVSAVDVSKFICALLEQDKNGERYILSAENMSYKELFTKIAQQMDVATPTIAIEGIQKLMARVKEFISNLSGPKSHYLTKESLENISERKVYSNQKSLSVSEFQYQPVSDVVQELSKSYLKSEGNKQH